jgi:uncharacterized protein
MTFRSRRPAALLATLVGALLVVGCTNEATRPSSEAGAPSATASSPESSPGNSSPTTGADSSNQGDGASTSAGEPEKVHPVSVPALFDKRYDGRRLRLGQVIVETDAYTQHFVTYRSDGLTISGILDRPRGRGPFPVLVLGHGYIDPAIYANGQGLRREQDWLARAGFAVLHTDYRNHASSDDDPAADRRLRLGYAVDMVNAVMAVKRSDLPFLDGERVGLLGRSMGGGVVYNALVARPGLVDAAVVYAPVSSRAADNFNRWIRDDADRSRLSQQIIDRYGAPERNREFWREASARTYFDRITEPVLIHHGTADESCPIRWSRASFRLLERAGVDATMFTYPGQPHAFDVAWPESMRRTVRFFHRQLDG